MKANHPPKIMINLKKETPKRKENFYNKIKFEFVYSLSLMICVDVRKM